MVHVSKQVHIKVRSQSTNFPLRTIISHFKPLNMKKIMTYGTGNQGSGLGNAQNCGGIKVVNGIPSFNYEHDHIVPL
jgi:hypothetical protein